MSTTLVLKAKDDGCGDANCKEEGMSVSIVAQCAVLPILPFQQRATLCRWR